MLTNNRNCRHILDPVAVGNKTIYCSSWKDIVVGNSLGNVPPINFTPDFGLYADFAWRNESRNEYINWPDFSVPSNPDVAINQILDALVMAETQIVEIGCIGAHGRTGTILACMAIAEMGIDSSDAIIFVKENYCSKAIETSSQEMFIEYFWRSINER